MQMMREASQKKQIFITTHNPEIIRHVDLENLYLVSRDDDGFSQITKPSDSEIVRHFLEDELGVDDLFVQNLLGSMRLLYVICEGDDDEQFFDRILRPRLPGYDDVRYFENLLDEDAVRTGVLQEILSSFSVERARTKNLSFDYFCTNVLD